MDLRGQIMNILADANKVGTDDVRLAYLHGHRDARHAAAELARKADAELDALRKDAERLDWIAQQSLEDLSFALVVDGAGCGKYYVSGDAYEAGYGPTLRTAIDAAMAPKGKPLLQAPKTSAP